MRVRVLGTAAGGGLPQWNCACDGCRQARAAGVDRTQDCLAVSGDGRAWYLVNASPDLRTQLLRTPELAPGPGRRDTPLRGVLFTSAELDHTFGLLSLREAGQLTVHATAPVRHALRGAFPLEPVLARYTRTRWETVVCGQAIPLDGGLSVTAIRLSEKSPRYAEPHAGDDWVIGYRIDDVHSGSTLLYAPCLAAWTDTLSTAVRDADAVILDGTFYGCDEMATRTGLDRPAAGMGHLPIRDSLPHLAAHAGPRYLYTHLNNTNPLTHPDAPQHAALAEAGAAVATDGQLLSL
ncbi:pyrroloquinoline quinone biosynthesis protein PqqB [Rugosimonospora africana]|uniref:Coenzyme PQQ synthesis protein B n=1 Tax=Rugosimonospora africana TaxID=556532 RepID=A0A8J3QSH1_9ACTN|nr:pyrroloquinoline quinone biosynthesis protein PqqB [Rugosimonospora africana]GIH15979.1 coenzyme PQQ synthesis protein B [Rugosimonospora africana]